MNIFRKIGIAIVMIVPWFVFSGLFYSWFHTKWVALAAFIVFAVIYSLIITGKFSRKEQDA